MMGRTTTAEMVWMVVLLGAVAAFVVVTESPPQVPKDRPCVAAQFEVKCVRKMA